MNAAADRSLADRMWRGYHPRTAAPCAAIAAAASAVLLAGRWSLDDVTAALIPYAIVLALWPGLLGVPLYRMITYTYRITDRALLVDRGFRNPPEPPIWLAEVVRVDTHAHWLDRQLGIGKITIAAAGGRTVLLAGLRDPESFAKFLRSGSEAAKARMV